MGAIGDTHQHNYQETKQSGHLLHRTLCQHANSSWDKILRMKRYSKIATVGRPSTQAACYLFALEQVQHHQPQGITALQGATRTHRYPVSKGQRYTLRLATNADMTNDGACLRALYAQVRKRVLAYDVDLVNAKLDRRKNGTHRIDCEHTCWLTRSRTLRRQRPPV